MKSEAYSRYPDYKVGINTLGKRVQVYFDGVLLIDTSGALEVLETKHQSVLYFPRAEINADALTPSDLSTHCPFKGDASYWHVKGQNQRSENCLWAYLTPFDEVSELADYAAFYADRVEISYMD